VAAVSLSPPGIEVNHVVGTVHSGDLDTVGIEHGSAPPGEVLGDGLAKSVEAPEQGSSGRDAPDR